MHDYDPHAPLRIDVRRWTGIFSENCERVEFPDAITTPDGARLFLRPQPMGTDDRYYRARLAELVVPTKRGGNARVDVLVEMTGHDQVLQLALHPTGRRPLRLSHDRYHGAAGNALARLEEAMRRSLAEAGSAPATITAEVAAAA